MRAVREVDDSLLGRIHARQARVGVVGLGYVGLPLSIAFGEAGFPVLGLDIDARKIEKLKAGESYISSIASAAVERLIASGSLQATTDFKRAGELDCIVICVPTPLTSAREPDMSFIIQTAESLAPIVRKEQLYVLESTTYPGTTDEVLRPILESGGLKAGADFYLAYSPEREDPGNKRFTTKTIPKIVGGYTPRCLEVALALYG
ncbi:MAG TPA: nucleotide sugar dehydrogenase, partial [Myxococcaceae bacterium]|nr:nucleotide sugar dehydrogenase [Myxococcaceae bacterium]